MGWTPDRIAHRLACSVTWGALACALALPSAAADGVIEINQTLALGGGVITGDAPGFPVSIDEPGSYVLTSNLTTAALDDPTATTAIVVSADNVTLDMNGFSISGPTVCSCSTATSCTPTGTAGGIEVSSLAVSGLTVFNGSIAGMPDRGVQAGRNARIYQLTVSGNGNTGATAGANSLFERVISTCNGAAGVVLTADGTAEAITAQSNKLSGIEVGTGAVVGSSTSNENGGAGIMGGSGSAVHDSSAQGNLGAGIVVGPDGTVRGNATSGNFLAGFSVTGASLVSENKATNNTGVGFSLSPGSGYQGNIASGNSAGTITGGVSLGTNLCDGVFCP